MMFTAMVALAVVVVVAMGVGVKAELSGQIVCNCRVCRAADPAKQLDACLCKGVLCPGADAAAEHRIGIVLGQKVHQCTVALPVGGNDLAGRHLSVLDLVELELCRVAEMLEYHTVFIRNCDLHGNVSFFLFFYYNITQETIKPRNTELFCGFFP